MPTRAKKFVLGLNHARLARLVEAKGHLRFLRRSIELAHARLAQLVEQLIYTEKVGGSSPSPRT